MHTHVYMYIYARTPRLHDAPQQSCHLFVYRMMSSSVLSEVHKPSVFTVVCVLHTYGPLLVVLVCGICKPPPNPNQNLVLRPRQMEEIREPFSIKNRTQDNSIVSA